MPEESTLINYHQGTASPEEVERVKRWLAAENGNQQVYEELIKIWEHAAQASIFQGMDLQGDWETIKQRATPSAPIRSISSKPSWRRYWGIAAAILLLLGIGINYWLTQSSGPSWQVAQTQADATSPMLLELADGSSVWLNRDSKLEYPSAFEGKKRQVRLRGEAYFDIASNPEQPFEIIAGKSKTEVLGTKFNLSAYEEVGDVILSVEEGSVRFSSTLLPNQRSIFTAGQQGRIGVAGELEVLEDPIHPNSLSWKTGKLMFDQTPLTQVIFTLIAHYQRTIIWSKTASGKECLITTTIVDQSLEEVLEELVETASLTYQIEGDQITIEGACE